MEEQGKRLMLAVVVAFAIMLLWHQLFPSAPPEQAKDGRQPASETAAGGAAEKTNPATGAPSTPRSAGSPAAAGTTGGAASAARGPEQILALEHRDVRVEFSSWGGALKSWKLLGGQFHEPGHSDRAEDLVRLADSARRPFQVSFGDGSTFTIPVEAEWQGEKKSDREVVYTWQSEDLAVEKRFRLYPENYLLALDVALKPKRGLAKQALVVSVFSQQDPRTKTDGGWSQQPREWVAACYASDELDSWGASAIADQVREKRGGVDWAGFLHSYFLFTVAPRAAADNLGCRAYGVATAPGGMGVDLLFPLTTLDAAKGDELRTGLIAYLGPKYLEKLQAIAATVDVSPGFEKAVDLGFWSFIAGPLLWLLEQFYGFVGSWGISIIFLTIAVKLATLYWTHKSMKSMKEMGKLRPQLEKIREKFKDDRQKQQVETMNLFKAHGVNPLAGCLPLLLQMPIWFALYRALSVAAQLYQAKFLWLSDLTAPDPFFILPIVMTGAMLVQSRLTPTTGVGMQQKMLTYGMPLMFGVMGFFFPAGLNLYIVTNTTLTLLHHLYMRQTGAKAGAAPSAKVAADPVGGSEKSRKGEVVVSAVEERASKNGPSKDDGDEVVAPAGRNGQRSGESAAGAGRGSRSGRRGGRRKRSGRPS